MPTWLGAEACYVARMSPGKRTIALLACAQGLLLTNGVMLVAVNGLTGLSLAPDRRLATLPVTSYVLGSALATLPASHFMKRFGRRRGFALGAGFGVVGGAVSALAMQQRGFWLLCAASLLSGIYNAFGQYYRFAAADVAPAEGKSRAISLTLAGGLLGAFVGPALGKWTRDLLEPRFVASYLVAGALALPTLALALSMRAIPHSAEEQHGQGRPLAVVARQPAFVVAVAAAAVGYGVMSLLMSATPLAMDMCGLSFSDAAFVLQWHVIGMFAPSFVTGSLIKRFGVHQILIAGAALMLACVAIAVQGESLQHFFWALLALGLGWNFLYVGGTTLLTETYAPAEKAKTQGLNDLLVFIAMVASSLTAGVVVTGAGWFALNYLALPLLALIALAALWLRWKPAVPVE
jgi:predicted MFS family arabinose efflux permease